MTSISDKFAEVKDKLLMELMPFGTSSMLVLHPNMTHSLLLCQNERFKNRSSNYSPEIELKISKYLTCPTSTLSSVTTFLKDLDVKDRPDAKSRFDSE